MNKQYVGICLPKYLYNKLPTFGFDLEENLELYEEGAKLYGVDVCYFRWLDIQPGQPMIQAYVKTESGYQLRIVETPKVIFNRTMTYYLKIRRKIKALRLDGRHIFNSYIQDKKHYIHTLMMQNLDFLPHLPETLFATTDSIRYMMDKHDELFIKPTDGYQGYGIMKLKKESDNQWCLSYPTMVDQEIQKIYFEYELPDFLLQTINNRSFIIQQRIPLDTHKGCPYDIRIHVQRDETGDWKVTGVCIRRTSKSGIVTNITQGGTLHTFEEIIEPSRRTDVYQTVTSLALKVAKHLSLKLPHLADLGIDIGITKDRVPFFIECNFRPHRHIYNKLNLVDEYRLTYTRPLAYARYLLDNAVDN